MRELQTENEDAGPEAVKIEVEEALDGEDFAETVTEGVLGGKGEELLDCVVEGEGERAWEALALRVGVGTSEVEKVRAPEMDTVRL